jgi:hypothetical protein
MLYSLFSFSTLFLLSFVYGGTDYGCDHYSGFTTDVCLPVGSYYEVLYTCNDTDTMIRSDYLYGDCGTTDGETTAMYSYDISGDSTYAECGNDAGCGYFMVVCGEDTSYSVYSIVDTCYSYTSSSAMYTCSGSTLTTTGYTNDDCSGTSSSSSTDYSTTYTATDCVFTCEAGSDSGSSANTLNIKNTLLFCSIALFVKLLF